MIYCSWKEKKSSHLGAKVRRLIHRATQKNLRLGARLSRAMWTDENHHMKQNANVLPVAGL